MNSVYSYVVEFSIWTEKNTYYVLFLNNWAVLDFLIFYDVEWKWPMAVIGIFDLVKDRVHSYDTYDLFYINFLVYEYLMWSHSKLTPVMTGLYTRAHKPIKRKWWYEIICNDNLFKIEDFATFEINFVYWNLYKIHHFNIICI